MGEDMEIVEEVIDGYWSERYLINHADKEGFELKDQDLKLKFITAEDIDWKNVETIAIAG